MICLISLELTFFLSLFQNVYELVVRHYLACVSQPAVAAETTVEIDIAGERFSASGRAILAVRLVPHYFSLDLCGYAKVYCKAPLEIVITSELLSAVDR